MSDNKAISQNVAESSGGFSSSDYNAVARTSSLAMIRLVKTEFECEPDFHAFEDQIKLSVNRQCLTCSVSDDGDAVMAMFKFRAMGKYKRRTLFKGEAVYAIMYDLPEGGEENAAQAFCRNVGQYAAYPYFRSLMSQYAWAAEASLPPLPVIASDPKLSVKKEPAD